MDTIQLNRPDKPKRVAVLGSTGSIGRQALEVIARHPGLRACALAAGSNWEMLGRQARWIRPDLVALANAEAADMLRPHLPSGVTLISGEDAITEFVVRSRPDVLLTGLVGSAGLAPTMAAIECGATLAIANKETLVMAGGIVMPAARSAGVDVLPVDSEHSAIFQCLACGRREEVRKVVITGSGGALRDWHVADVANATVEDALSHPTWEMGRKITIDSATMMNKALEVVEAHWLFGLEPDEIDVVIHPESIVHSMVEFRDGSVIAQMGHPDMTVPIAHALNYPHRRPSTAKSLDLAALGSLTFLPLDPRFQRAVNLGFETIRRGGLTGAVLNGANEAAVEAFLTGKIPFGQIVPLVEHVLNLSADARQVSVEDLLAADTWARQQVLSEAAGNDRPTSRVVSEED